MTMKSKDILKQEFMTNLAAAMNSEDENAITQAFVDFADSIQQGVLEDVRAYQETQDKEILQKRGIHQLTQKETEFYQSWIDASKKSNPRQAITDLDIALPFTVIDNVMEDLKVNHPLLNLIDFQNMTAVKKMLFNKKGKQLAVWGAINDAITKELSGAIGEVDITVNKLSAFMPVSKDMLEVGPQWLDAYVRAILSEAIAYGLEEGIINGTGKGQPIGMIRDIHDGVSVSSSDGYPAKSKKVITELTDTVIGELFATLAKDPIDSNKSRTVNANDIVLIVNPFDYFKKVLPSLMAIKRMNAMLGIGDNPFDIKNVIQSDQMGEGSAVLGLASKYKMGLGSGSSKGGKIEYSDDYKFLEDQRYYLVKLLGNGRASSDNDFIYLDISGLKPTNFNVNIASDVNVGEVKGVVKTKEQA
ncbi:phage major capsid protein [Clostridium paraputrificum]|uniref:phage major capsid protein n=1 Tax=Clostridium paraputrificum TaxID=29363 RepID=UPI001FAB9BD9|nr:phage major capsid protein [Clostridium paraputrificum]MDC0802707.1 phage major capsid protein [Clostridium paraputrificum]